MPVGSLDDFAVAHRAAGLDHRGSAGRVHSDIHPMKSIVAANLPIHSRAISVVATASFQIGVFRISGMFLRAVADREDQATDDPFAARNSGTARKTLVANAICSVLEFRKNMPDRSRKRRSYWFPGKLPRLPAFVSTRIGRRAAPLFL
jgi:hypothetical protein